MPPACTLPGASRSSSRSTVGNRRLDQDGNANACLRINQHDPGSLRVVFVLLLPYHRNVSSELVAQVGKHVPVTNTKGAPWTVAEEAKDRMMGIQHRLYRTVQYSCQRQVHLRSVAAIVER